MKSDNYNLKIAVQKSGRIADKSFALLRDIGLNFEISDRSLFTKCENFPLEIMLVRDDDIPEMVELGVVDLGIVGENIILELNKNIIRLKALNFGKCKFVIAVPNESGINRIEDLNGKKIATSYPFQTKQFFESRNVKVEIIVINGAVEITPLLNMADAIADLSSSGSTLKMHELREIEEVFKSEVKLISNPNSLTNGRKKLIDKLLLRIDSLLCAKKNKYVMMNLPEQSLPKISELIPGITSPTIMPLNRKGYVALHSVVAEEVFWDTIEKLKELGATGILVSPIEKMVV